VVYEPVSFGKNARFFLRGLLQRTRWISPLRPRVRRRERSRFTKRGEFTGGGGQHDLGPAEPVSCVCRAGRRCCRGSTCDLRALSRRDAESWRDLSLRAFRRFRPRVLPPWTTRWAGVVADRSSHSVGLPLRLRAIPRIGNGIRASTWMSSAKPGTRKDALARRASSQARREVSPVLIVMQEPGPGDCANPQQTGRGRAPSAP